jgi:hypothetical protein
MERKKARKKGKQRKVTRADTDQYEHFVYSCCSCASLVILCTLFLLSDSKFLIICNC